ncbi:hypothetical protein DYU11_17425 [Fibrisoma montanum]|uniref:Lipoprotein n=1 Tax=Fibrisoma montanum TaxID=2305895 RepID=A0A418M5Z4_9BACT|nr:hypothetical protein [Fibrisoma montanum]RIV21206.1 hypothetical protein DYU11_17425 [Fibrisoma montanum]
MRVHSHILTLLLGGLLAVGCQSSVENEALPQDKGSLVVAASQSARVGEDATLQIEKIEDSRCPANVVCVRFGNANVFYLLSQGTESREGILCLGDCGVPQKTQDSTTVQLGTERYQLILKEVRPYPGTSPVEVKPEAVIQVKRI